MRSTLSLRSGASLGSRKTLLRLLLLEFVLTAAAVIDDDEFMVVGFVFVSTDVDIIVYFGWR